MTSFSMVTIATGSYLPGAAVTSRSFLEHHPEGQAVIVLVDGATPLTSILDPRVEVVTADRLFADPDELLDQALLYGPLELATSLKPLALRWMLDNRSDTVIFLDADTKVFASLDLVASAAVEHGAVLTPHRDTPVPADGLQPDEELVLATGAFNTGVVGVSPSGRPLLDWWWQSLRRDCVRAPLRQRYIDQRIIDHAATIGHVGVVRDRGCNVGYWNADTHSVHRAGSAWMVDGSPLRLFHFSGFDPDRPWMLRPYAAPPLRVRLSEAPGIAELCATYAQDLQDAGWARAHEAPYRFGSLADGTPIDSRMREVYRSLLVRADRGLGGAPPNPFRPGELAAFWALLNERHPDHPRVTRYQFEVWRERSDVAGSIGSLQASASDRFSEWLLDHGDIEHHIPARLLPERPVLSAFRDAHATLPPRANGLAVAGFVDAVVGVGQAARLAMAAARASGIEPEVVSYENTMSENDHQSEVLAASDAVADVALVCLNPDVLPNFADGAGAQFRRGRRVVGLWFWEVDVPTDAMAAAFEHVDEVWVTTEHVRQALLPIATKPVEIVALPLVVDDDVKAPADPRERLGLPSDRFTFLFNYDTFSIPERKNPLGLLDAFCRAFQPDEGPLLVIKTLNSRGDATAEHLHHLAAARPDVILLDKYLTRDDLLGLTAAVDCYVSLHRAEGWGLTLAEAMAVGTPVVATAYSGSTSFMDATNSYGVPYDLVSVGPDAAPYPPHAVWAEPDLTIAASVLRQVWEHPHEAALLGERARRDILTNHTPAAVAPAFAAAVDQARSRITARS